MYSLLELELRVGDLHRVLGDGLAVLAAGVAPADVLVGGLVHVPARRMVCICICIHMYVYMYTCIYMCVYVHAVNLHAIDAMRK